MNDLPPWDLSPDELADQIDAALSGHPAQDARVDIAVRLANANHPQMSPEMLARVQSKVIATHRQQVRRRRWRYQSSVYVRLAAAVLIIMIFFSATALPALASSVPGDFWYPFKRNIETVELTFAPSSAARADVYLTQAQRRVNEARTLLKRKVFNTNLLLEARNDLATFGELSAQAGTPLTQSEAQVALVTESMSLLLQDAEQDQILSGDQIVALLPTIIPVPPSNTPVPTAVPSATTPPMPSALPTEVPQVAVVTEDQPVVVATATPIPSDTPAATPSDTPTATLTATLTPAAQTMYALENANVRSQPGQNATIVTLLHRGDSTQVTGEDAAGRWWHIKLTDGREGWIAKFLLSVDAPPPVVPANNASGNGDGSNPQGNCEHPGDYCNAPGQTGTLPAQAGGNPGSSNGKPDNPPGNGGNPPSNPGGGHKP